MLKHIRTMLTLGLLLILALALCLQAQDITKGTISGVVRDASGAMVGGAKVKLESPNGDRSATTSGLGEYSFANLVVGSDYVLTVEQPGFMTAKAVKVAVGINRRTTLDFTLEVGTTSTSVEVTGGAASIDMGTTNVGATFDESLYKNVPVGRNISALINMSPGVSDSAGAGTANPSINGASGLENQYVINGANVTDPAYGGFGTYSRVYGSKGNGINFDFIQEVQILSGGFEAQYGQALGGVVNVLTKSGGNAYHGSFYGYFGPQQFEATRPDLNQQLTNKVVYVQHLGSYDFGADLGGHLKKDKLFWYGGFNPRFDQSFRSAAAGFANAALGIVNVSSRTFNYVGKINYNISQKHQLEGSVFGDPSTTPTTFNGASSLNTLKTGPPDYLTTSSLDYGSRTWTGRYSGTLTNRWVVTANFSDYYNKFDETPAFDGYRVTDNTPGQDGTGSNFAYGGLGFRENSESKVHQFTVTSSHIFSALGGHTLEYGYQFEDQNYADFRLNTGADFQLPNLPVFKDAAGKTQHGAALTRTHPTAAQQAATGLPASAIVLRVTRGDYSDPSVTTLSRYNAGFIQDSWTIGNRLTIKPGLRFEQQAMAGNALRYVFAHNWAPRVGVILDPSGKRKSKFFANWGRFYEKVPSDISIRAFSFETSVIGALYKDAGPQGTPNLSASNYIPGGAISFQGSPSDLTLVAPGTGAQYQDEVVGGYEHQFSDGFVFSGRFVYRHMRRIIEDISGVSVTQANAGVPQQYVVSNPSAKLDIFKNSSPCKPGTKGCVDYGDGIGFTDFGDNPLGADGTPDGFPNATRIYKSMELVFSKRFTNNFQVYANYTLSKLYGNFQGSFRSDNGQTDPNISSLFDFTNSDGLLTDQVRAGVLPTDRRNQFKLFGNYSWKGVNMGLGWNITSGSPISKFLDHPVYANSGEVPVGGRGSQGRTQWTFPINLHTDYSWKLGETKRLKFMADLFNLTNQVRPFTINQNAEVSGSPGTANADFLHVLSYQAPFNARLGVRFEF